MQGTAKREHFGMCSNDVILYVPPLGQRKRKICIVSDLPESLLPELRLKDPNKDRDSSERVGEGKETICLYVWGFEIKVLSYKYWHQMLQRGQVVGGLLSSSSSSSIPASGPQ